jgi:DNA-binding CsgD family transcriptional regulator
VASDAAVPKRKTVISRQNYTTCQSYIDIRLNMNKGNDSEIISIRHKQILDAAADHPDASLDELASMVTSATEELVQRVLDEHGDPAANTESDGTEDNAPSAEATGKETPTTEEASGDTAATADATHSTESPALTDLTIKQRTVLEYVAMDPSATQREIGEQLGVTAATVGNRVNDIKGFSWDDRQSFIEQVFDAAPGCPAT